MTKKIFEYPISIYEKDGFDYKIAVVRMNEKSCSLYYLNDVNFKFLSGLSTNTSELTEDAIMSQVEIDFAISKQYLRRGHKAILL